MNLRYGFFSSILTISIFFAGNFTLQGQKTLISDNPMYTTPHSSSVLDVYSNSKGLLIPRLSTAPAGPTGGLMYYNTTSNSFWYHDGSVWKELLYVKYWDRSSATQIYATDLIANHGIGTNLPLYQFHLFDPGVGGSGSLSPQLVIENSFPDPNNPGHISIGFFDLLFPTPLVPSYVMGVDRLGPSDIGSFKLQNANQIQSASQGDGITKFRTFPSGIIDFNNQSRARAYQGSNPHLDPPTSPYGQPIANSIWTPVYFDILSYDQQNEFKLQSTPIPPMGGGPAQSYFTVTESGYYQVNARVDFAWKEYDLDDLPRVIDIFTPPIEGGYVSIAIVVTDVNGTISMYAQGNKLQGHSYPSSQGELVEQNGLAPNVSDVLSLKRGDQLEIWVWQSVHLNPIPLRVIVVPPDDAGLTGQILHNSQVYVSIHKVS